MTTKLENKVKKGGENGRENGGVKKSYELLLDPKEDRPNLLPIVYHDIWDEFLKHEASHWTHNEVRYTEDLPDWNEKVDVNGKRFIKTILAFFASSDKIVNEKEAKDSAEIRVPEYTSYIISKQHRELVHTLTYQFHLLTLVPDEKERTHLFNSINTIKSIKGKADWCYRYINNGNFVERQVAFAITEGIFFSSSFCAIFWFKKRGLMPALCFSNELISKDEGCHRDFACMVYRKYVKNKLPREEVINMIKTAVELEKEFVLESLPEDMIGMNFRLMSQYVEYVADILYINLLGDRNGRIYSSENPFPWMVGIDVYTKANFFEKQASAYQDADIVQSFDETNLNKDLQYIEDF